MRSHTEYLTFNVPQRMGFINITLDIEKIVNHSGVQEGLLLCNAMHITASVFINDDVSSTRSARTEAMSSRLCWSALPLVSSSSTIRSCTGFVNFVGRPIVFLFIMPMPPYRSGANGVFRVKEQRASDPMRFFYAL